MDNTIEDALLQIEAEKKAGTSSFTPMEEVFAEIDRIIEEAKASET